MSMTAPMQYGRLCNLVVSDDKGNGLDLSELEVHFYIRHPSIETPQLAEIKVYNLSETTAKSIENEFTQVKLTAGYSDHFGVVFAGQIAQTKRGREEDAVNNFLSIYGQNSDAAYNYAIMNKTIAKGYQHSDVCKAIGDSFGQYDVTQGALPTFPAQRYPRGRTLYGPTKQHARTLAGSTGLSWNLDLDEFRMYQKHGATNNKAIVLSPDTGLLGVPEQTIDGISARCLLNSQIKIDSMVKIDQSLINPATLNFGYQAVNFLPKIAKSGIYRVLYVEHRGNTRGNEWDTEFICLDPNAPAPITPSVLGVGFYGPA